MMINKSVIYTVLAGLFIASSNLAYATNPSESVVIHYGGTISIPPCTIETPKVGVDFNDIQVTELSSASTATEWKTFELNLSDCTDVNSVDMTFTGAAQGNYFANSGDAKHLAIEMEYIPVGSNAVPVKPGTVLSPTLSNQATVAFPFQVRIRNNGTGAATAGSVLSIITVSYTFK